VRLVPAAGAAWAASAVATRSDAGTALVAAMVLTLLALIGIAGPRTIRHLLLPMAVPAAAAALVCFSASGSLAAAQAGVISDAIAAQASVTVELRAATDARQANPVRFSGGERYLVQARVEEATYNGKRFAARTPVLVIGGEGWQHVALGDVIRTAGVLAPARNGDRVSALLMAGTAPQIRHSPGWPRYTSELRRKFLGLSAGLGGGAAGLLPGMVIGDRSTQPAALEQDMKSTGLAHLTAVSGANCSLILAFVFLCARAMRLPRMAAVVLGLAALAGFVLLVRPDPSVLRAAVMGSIGVFAVLTGRGRVSLTLLLVSVILLLGTDPWLNSSFAFILSVAATAALVLFGPVLAERLSAAMPEPVARLTAIPLAAQIFCAPVLVLLQPQLPLYAVPANIAAAPAVAPVTILGMLAVGLLVLYPPAAQPLAAVAGWGAQWVAQVAAFFAAAPGAEIPWPGGAAGAALAALGSAAFVLAVVYPARIRSGFGLLAVLCRTVSSARYLPAACGAAGGLLGTALVLTWTLAHAPGAPHSWSLAACDVGQGDGFAVRTGPESAIVIDAGPEPGLMADCLDTLKVRTVDLLVITHLHHDHYGGAEGVFRGRTVRQLLFSSTKANLPDDVADLADRHGLEPAYIVRGMGGEAGYARWKAVWPSTAAMGGQQAAGENDASAVLHVAVDPPGPGSATALFTGDIEQDAAAALVSAVPALSSAGVDILKVSHHGARNGGTTLLRAVGPRLAMISSGAGNEYGHPHPEITSALAALGVAVARTDALGSYGITIGSDALNVRRLPAFP
jgi:DNA internalization-related competence protein ComEC/Rec2